MDGSPDSKSSVLNRLILYGDLYRMSQKRARHRGLMGQESVNQCRQMTVLNLFGEIVGHLHLLEEIVRQ